MKIRNLFMVVGFAAGMSAMSLSPSYAQSSDTVQEVQNQSFFKKKYRIKGSWSLEQRDGCLLYTSPSPRDATLSRMPSSA